MKNTSAMNWDVGGEYEESLSGNDMQMESKGKISLGLGVFCTLSRQEVNRKI